MRRSGVLIGGVILLAISVAIVMGLFGDTRPPEPDSPTGEIARDPGPTRDRAPVSVPIAEEPASAPASLDDLPDTKLPLLLLGTVFATVDATAPPVSLAVIEDQDSRTRQVVREGDALDADARVRVTRIEERRIILLRESRREALRIPSHRGRSLPISEDQLAALLERSIPGIPGVEQTGPAPEPSPDEALAEELRALSVDDGGMRSGPALLEQGRFSPRFTDAGDQIVGMQIDEIEPGSFFDRVGLLDGDIITAVNGIEIQTITAANEMLLEFNQAKEIEIELQNSDQTIFVSREQLDELLRR